MTVISTTSGRVRGEIVDGVHRFLSVPYAAAPVGKLRFAAPQPSTWDGERDATEPGDIAPQVNRTVGALNLAALVSADRPQGGDFLTVDVHSPDPSTGGLPVMVFIHGGAFVGGTGSAVIYDGSAFARRGVVLVTINYRLGFDGFLSLEGATNLGLRDQIAALSWVRDNAAAFGGDPDNVTVFGESAGGVSVACLLGSPLARGLFGRAIVQSGHSDMVRDAGRARQIAEYFAGKLGVPATAETFRGFTTEKLLAAQVEISTPGKMPDLRDEHGVDPLYGLTPFAPVLGDDVLPAQPRESLDAGVDLLAGFNAEEMKLYFVPTGVLGAVTEEQAVATLAASRPDAADVLRGYGLGKEESAGEVLSKALTDLVFADGVRRLLADHPGRSFGYRFDWRSPQFDGQLGACHGLELPFVFGTLPAATALVGPDAPRELADEMQQTWVRFAETGDPGWAAGAVRSFD